jgi:hypothetical protein
MTRKSDRGPAEVWGAPPAFNEWRSLSAVVSGAQLRSPFLQVRTFATLFTNALRTTRSTFLTGEGAESDELLGWVYPWALE